MSSGDDPLRLTGLARIYALAGRKTDARKILTELNHAAKTEYIAPYFLASIEGVLGEKDQAFTWLEQGYNNRDPYLTRLRVDVAMDPCGRMRVSKGYALAVLICIGLSWLELRSCVIHGPEIGALQQRLGFEVLSLA